MKYLDYYLHTSHLIAHSKKAINTNCSTQTISWIIAIVLPHTIEACGAGPLTYLQGFWVFHVFKFAIYKQFVPVESRVQSTVVPVMSMTRAIPEVPVMFCPGLVWSGLVCSYPGVISPCHLQFTIGFSRLIYPLSRTILVEAVVTPCPIPVVQLLKQSKQDGQLIVISSFY